MERNLSLVAMFAALIAVLGLVPPVNLGFGVPISAQTLGVMLAGTVLGARRGTLAVLLLIFLVLLGLPLLAGGRGGLGVLAGPTVGFFLGWPFAAFVTGLITERLSRLHVGVAAAIGSVLGGIVVLYVCGITGMAIVLGRSWIEAAGLSVAFVPGDILKAVLAGMLTTILYRARPRSVLSRA
ncbi:biotin transporter BioY [Palleronia sp. LCG004]|uniref:biotin transporter BioY n=1 Tax=Palleronia sp. LCG004 TaxID=3079304 RepID=UPI0029425D53|nr:biotin transporter BioY [Palleronia sp. LCG004]WOI56387.1 biotin transporter BioY [Palleronia sp. LCG004]